ncbi:MAG: MaoC/PaaZ C-terminal domain-containing protein [Dehalococcoidia bacterium]
MAEQVFYEDIAVGSEIPSLVKRATRRQLVQWAGASGDFYEIHYDKDFALASGLPDVILHGRLKASFLGQMLTDWTGLEGNLKKYNVRYRGMDFPDQELTCKGKVTKKYVENNEHLVELDIWTENPQGEKTITGSALISLPSKG